MHKNNFALLLGTLCLLLALPLAAQHHPIADEVAQRNDRFSRQAATPLLVPMRPGGPWAKTVQPTVDQAAFFAPHPGHLKAVLKQQPEVLAFSFKDDRGQSLSLQLFKADIFAPGFRVRRASQPERAVPFERGLHYRGIVNGDPHSLAMLYLQAGELMGVIEWRGQLYNLGRLEGAGRAHILYRADALNEPPAKACMAEDLPGYRPDTELHPAGRSSNSNNCVEMYIEVDYDIYNGKGGLNAAAAYVSGVFSQVSALYADEAVNLTVSEIFVWDMEDPYTGPSTGDYLNQFRSQLDGDYNGDLAHLVGYQGGGGVAYLDVICSDNYGVAYSDINSTYNTVPTYSWTINVVAHEIGHNLGAPHTHNCAWNGNNTPIDNCGPQAGYTAPGCYDNGVTPDAGTIMSYCHLLGGVGISFTENFGPQPGDLIRDRVYNANCLQPCAISNANDVGITAILQPNGTACGNTLEPVATLANFGSELVSSVRIEYTLDGNPAQSYTLNLSLAPQASTNITLPALNLSPGAHTLSVGASEPNGLPDDNNFNNEADADFVSGNNVVTLNIDLDNYPAETTWSVSDANNNVLAAGGPYDGQATATESFCLPPSCFTFAIFDSYGDGICCDYGNGSYQLVEEATGTVLASGGDFGDFEATDFCLSANAECFEPTNLNVTQISSTSALLTWNDMPGVPEYRVVYLPDGGTYQIATVTSNFYWLNGLQPDTGYDWGVRSQCETENSDYQIGPSFTTLPDGGCEDSDADGVCDDDDQCPGLDDNLIGTPCDDGNDCTADDIYTSDCQCEGTFADGDGDGICDAEDQCPGLADNLIGTACDDGDPCTFDDVYTADCVCAGTPADSDGDGVCDSDDQCPGFDDNLIGTPCDDGDDCTTNDTFTANCDCVGELIDANNNDICDLDEGGCGVPVGLAASGITATTVTLSWAPAPGANTYRLQYLPDGQTAIQSLDVSGTTYQLTGLSPNTGHLWRVRSQCDGENSAYSEIMDFTTAPAPCPDGDGDGVCDAEDQCPGLDDALIGTACDDGEDCTENDTYGPDCNCAGTLIDVNNNSICDLDEGCPAPTGLAATPLSPSSASVSWPPVPNADEYRLQYRPIGGQGVSVDIASNDYVINNLPAGATIQWRVFAICGPELSSFTVGPAFTLPSGMPLAEGSAPGSQEKLEVALFPNPARGQVTITLSQPGEPTTVTVHNVLGELMATYPMGGQQQLRLPTAGWGHNQLVWVTVRQRGRAPVTQRLLLAR